MGEARESNGVGHIDTAPPVEHSFGAFRRVSNDVRYEALFFNLNQILYSIWNFHAVGYFGIVFILVFTLLRILLILNKTFEFPKVCGLE